MRSVDQSSANESVSAKHQAPKETEARTQIVQPRCLSHLSSVIPSLSSLTSPQRSGFERHALKPNFEQLSGDVVDVLCWEVRAPWCSSVVEGILWVRTKLAARFVSLLAASERSRNFVRYFYRIHAVCELVFARLDCWRPPPLPNVFLIFVKVVQVKHCAPCEHLVILKGVRVLLGPLNRVLGSVLSHPDYDARALRPSSL